MGIVLYFARLGKLCEWEGLQSHTCSRIWPYIGQVELVAATVEGSWPHGGDVCLVVLARSGRESAGILPPSTLPGLCRLLRGAGKGFRVGGDAPT
jgi:hypothetical protein